MVGRPHGLLVVFDDDDRVALVAELGHGFQQAVVISGVQADGWFVENVEHADEPAADLPGQTDALHFATAERGRGAVQRKVV